MSYVSIDTESFYCSVCARRHLLALGCVFNHTQQRYVWYVARQNCVIDKTSQKIHGIANCQFGFDISHVLQSFDLLLEQNCVTRLVAHDVCSDLSLLLHECGICDQKNLLSKLCRMEHICTKLETFKKSHRPGSSVKWPSLHDAYCTAEGLVPYYAHDPVTDAEVCAFVFEYLTNRDKKKHGS